ncbi:MAG: hypothetical protein A3J65_00220 [Candidatus Buchananbacteria bacterium RIFCSPHIGHO2_02_FULL_45_11b]|uniref:EamA domain-containing protein n=1 Tax=Candidatus Buchananbacteria bacterium RIFCSPHIGHO2_02_FULL_45_11b TaxID=1797541 RepID=A0A1G1YK06_9BACT|nr:MAG: hypothetical protein A3J65_00220 [Candidatus Buchananbacteria bacterium RIFCSPHIGHO2_02_FULL_45_11b]
MNQELGIRNKAILLVLATAVISGFANFFNKFGMKASGFDPFQYTTLKNVLAALVLSLLVLTPWVFSRLKKLNKKDWLSLAIIGLIGWSVPFLLFFKGLSLTSAVSASFIHKTLFVWVAILAWPVLKEKVSKWQFIALGVLLSGNMIFEGFAGLSWSLAETLIFSATIMWAVETIIAKKVLANINSSVLAWGRMFFGALILIGFLSVTKDLPNLAAFNSVSIGWLALVSILLTGYVLTWYAALKKLPATVVACVLVLASPITAMLNAAFVTHKGLSADKILGLVFIGLAVILLSLKLKVQSSKLLLEKQN